MTKLLMAILSIYWLSTPRSEACSIFLSPFDTQVAHNVDWFAATPNVMGMFVLNPANLYKKATVYNPAIKTAEWISKYRSLSFSIAGAEFPVSGFNEKGLFMGILMLHDASYPPDGDARLPMAPSQLVQYNLDSSATIADVIASTKVVRPSSKLIKMHYFACDKSGRCVVLQYLNGEVSVYSGRNLPYNVLTNSPYPDSRAAAESCKNQSCPAGDNSLWRFAEVGLLQARMSAKDPFSDQAFAVLDQVAQTGDIATKFQLTYDPVLSRMNVRVGGRKAIAFVDADLSQVKCGGGRKVIPLSAASRGDISGQWQDLTEKMQYDYAIAMGLPPALAAQAGHYPFETVCR